MSMAYRPELDGLRAIAVLAVLGFHFAGPFVTGGSLGVDVFFTLSGFLITSILVSEYERKGRIDVAAFLWRRILRLAPALIVLLTIYWVLCPLLWPTFVDQRNRDVLTAIFYLTNLRQTFWPDENPLSHTWSLAIEEQFYVLWPWVIPALLRMSRGSAARLLLVAWAALTVCRYAWYLTLGGAGSYYFTPLHSTGILLGSALALNPIPFRWGKIALVALMTLFIAGQTRTSLFVTIPVAEILTVVIIANVPLFLAARPMQWVGRTSYGIYLWHVPIAWAVGFPRSLVDVFWLIAASVAAGALSHWGVERWFIRRTLARPLRAA